MGSLNNYKTFISHSTFQNDFVSEIVKELGRDYVNVDLHSFEAGEELSEEIAVHVQGSNIFVLLLSDQALDSKWIKQETAIIHEKIIDEDCVVFLPFIIDKMVSIDDSRLDDKKLAWTKRYLIAAENSPSIVARIIRRRLKETIWEHEPNIKEKDKLFFGRDNDMSDLRLKLYGSLNTRKRCIIISGLAHVGRKRLIKEFIWRHINDLHEAYDPIRVFLSESDSIDRFVQQLNEIVRLYDNDAILDIMRDSGSCLELAVDLLNKIADCRERVFIRDEKCIVLGNGRLTDWFIDLIKHRRLYPMIHLFVASKYTPVASVERSFPEVIVRQIKGIDKPNITALFNAYASNRRIKLDKEQVNEFTSQLKGYPRQVYDVVDCIVDNDLHTAKRQLPQIVTMFDGNLVDILNDIDRTVHAKDILVLLSKFEFVSFDLLEKVCPDDITDALALFRDYSLYESFGSANQYIRLSPAMADYVSRSRMKLPLRYAQALRKTTRLLLTEMDDSLTDLSTQLLGIKELLKDSSVKAKERYLIPSFVLKVIIEEYKERTSEHLQNVIDIAEMLINNNLYGGYIEIDRSIHYWYCCALCRKKDPKFLTAVEYFRDSNYSFNFLKGFYERQQGPAHYRNAESFYEKALEQSKYSHDREFVSKAEHELVIVKIELDDYPGALELAKNSFEREKDNAYHIEAYFRCLVRTPHPDKELLKELINRMERSYDTGKDTIAETMKAEYIFYIDKNFSGAILLIKQILMNDFSEKKSYAERALKNICKDAESDNLYYSVMREVKSSRKH